MNRDQVMSMIRSALKIAGTVVVTYGFVSDSDWTTVTTEVDTIGGAVAILVPIGLSWFAHTDKNKIAVVAAMPEVKTIVTDSATADLHESPKVVSR